MAATCRSGNSTRSSQKPSCAPAARALVIGDAATPAAALRALAGARLETLVLDTRSPDGLEALGALKTLRQLELGHLRTPAAVKRYGADFLPRYSPSLSPALMARLQELPQLEALTLRSCLLDAGFVESLPRRLQRLDLYDCFGVDGRLVDVIAAMPELRELGVPMQRAPEESNVRGMFRLLGIEGTDLNERRLASAEVVRVLRGRPWEALRLDGTLTPEVAAALRDQPSLRELRLSLDGAGVALDFVAALPKLERVVFEGMFVSNARLAPLAESRSLRQVVIEVYGPGERVGSELPERIQVRRVTRQWR